MGICISRFRPARQRPPHRAHLGHHDIRAGRGGTAEHSAGGTRRSAGAGAGEGRTHVLAAAAPHGPPPHMPHTHTQHTGHERSASGSGGRCARNVRAKEAACPTRAAAGRQEATRWCWGAGKTAWVGGSSTTCVLRCFYASDVCSGPASTRRRGRGADGSAVGGAHASIPVLFGEAAKLNRGV